MVRLLLDARFRTRDEGRSFVLLSLAEAETLRRVLHARLQEKEPILTLGCHPFFGTLKHGFLGWNKNHSFLLRCESEHQSFSDTILLSLAWLKYEGSCPHDLCSVIVSGSRHPALPWLCDVSLQVPNLRVFTGFGLDLGWRKTTTRKTHWMT